MQLDEDVRKQIVRNALLSVFIYALPVLLMFLSFYVTGRRPWQHAIPLATGTRLTGRHVGDLK